ncbi:MAG: hypothetical protein ABI548_10750 [Polyangiaceae bacterium]
MTRAAARRTYPSRSARCTRLLRLALACAVLCSAGSSAARSPSQVQTIAVGRSAAWASCEGIEPDNSSRAREPFPRAAEVRFRARVAGGIGQAPASDDLGNLLIAHGEPRLSKLDPRGHSLWSARLPSEASCSPTLLSSGAILIVTRDADALLFQPSGKLHSKRVLPLTDSQRRTFAIPTTSGGALIASGTDLLELDANGGLVRQARARGNVTALAESDAGLVAIGENGSVEVARATGDFELVGSLGGTVPEGGALQAGRVLAVVDAHKLVSFDLRTGEALILATDPALALSGPPALFDSQGSALVADGGLVSVRAPNGAETLRVSVAAASLAFDATARGLRAALVITDGAGGVAATRSGSDALLLNPDGTTRRIDNSACLDPFRPTPIQGGLVFSCRSGQLFAVSDKTP